MPDRPRPATDCTGKHSKIGAYAEAVQYVTGRAGTGVRMSELTPVQRRAAERLVDRGRLHYTRLPDGDAIIST